MKKKLQEWKAVALLSIGLGWWGFWYPELEQAAETYVVVLEDGTIQNVSEVIECELNGQYFPDLSQADRSRVKVSSKLWKLLQEYFEEDIVKQ